MHGDQHVNKSTDNYHFVVTFHSFMRILLNPSCYPSIMSNTFSDLRTYYAENYAGIIGPSPAVSNLQLLQ